MSDLLLKMPLQYEPMEKNRYTFSFKGMDTDEYFSLDLIDVKDVFNQPTTEVGYRCDSYSCVHPLVNGGEFEIHFSGNISYTVSREFMEWLRCGSETVTGRIANVKKLKRDAKLEKRDPLGRVMARYIFKGAFVSGANFGDLFYGSSDYADIYATIRYDYFTTETIEEKVPLENFYRAEKADILRKINEASAEIHRKSYKGTANYVVTSEKIAKELEESLVPARYQLKHSAYRSRLKRMERPKVLKATWVPEFINKKTQETILEPTYEILKADVFKADQSVRNVLIKVSGFKRVSTGIYHSAFADEKIYDPNGNTICREDLLSSLRIKLTNRIEPYPMKPEDCNNKWRGRNYYSSFSKDEYLPFRIVERKVVSSDWTGDKKDIFDENSDIFIEIDLAKPKRQEVRSLDGFFGICPANATREFLNFEFEWRGKEIGTHNAYAELTAILSEQLARDIDREILETLKEVKPEKEMAYELLDIENFNNNKDNRYKIKHRASKDEI